MKELPSDYQKFIHTSRYARWIEKEKRRETWTETVDRFIDFMKENLKDKKKDKYLKKKNNIKKKWKNFRKKKVYMNRK